MADFDGRQSPEVSGKHDVCGILETIYSRGKLFELAEYDQHRDFIQSVKNKKYVVLWTRTF